MRMTTESKCKNFSPDKSYRGRNFCAAMISVGLPDHRKGHRWQGAVREIGCATLRDCFHYLPDHHRDPHWQVASWDTVASSRPDCCIPVAEADLLGRRKGLGSPEVGC
jgi:hypothetical protein